MSWTAACGKFPVTGIIIDHMFTITNRGWLEFLPQADELSRAVSLFKYGIKSYRDLPVRLSEFGKVHRYEPSDRCMALLRVRHFTQDDAYLCTLQQVEGNVKSILQLVLDIYKQFGFEEVAIRYPLVLKSGCSDARLG